MKAAFMDGPEHFVLREVDKPVLEEKEVLIRVRACGICGSDLSMYKLGMEDRIMGHEFSGEIVELGPGVDGWNAGDRVVVEPLIICGECAWCKHGQYNLCPSLGFTGLMADGAFAEYVKVPAYQLHRLPDELSWLQGALVEPLSVSLHGVTSSIMRPGDPVAVLGCGIIGLFTLLWARALGAGRLIASEVAPARILADVVLNPAEVDLSTELEKLTDGLGPRVVFECSGVPDVQAGSIDLVQRGGQVILLGISYDAVPLVLLNMNLKEISVRGCDAFSSLNGVGEFPITLQFLKDKRIDPEIVPLTSMPLDRINEGFKAAKAGEYAKVVLIPE
jgi:(R,R)-butanediol dehydrogenase/meso-butanediol dehydrogenase/diacetyl reductase